MFMSAINNAVIVWLKTIATDEFKEKSFPLVLTMKEKRSQRFSSEDLFLIFVGFPCIGLCVEM